MSFFAKLVYIKQVRRPNESTETASARTSTGYFKNGCGIDVVQVSNGFSLYYYETEEKENYQKIGFYHSRDRAFEMGRRVLGLPVWQKKTKDVSRENILYEAIRKRKMTQGEFAKKVGISEMTVSRLINGKNLDIRISLFDRLKKESRIPYKDLLDYLLGRSA